MYCRKNILLILENSLKMTAAVLCLSLATLNVNATEFADDEIMFFDGVSRLVYQDDSALTIQGPTTVEFWVSPSWLEEATFDPCIISSIGDKGVNFAIHIGADRQSIGLYSGSRYVSLPYDFSEQQMYHVTVISLSAKLTEIRINGEAVGMFALGFGDGNVNNLYIGSLDGEQAPFMGALARLRIWDTLVDENTDTSHLIAESIISSEGFNLAIYIKNDSVSEEL